METGAQAMSDITDWIVAYTIGFVFGVMAERWVKR